MSGPTCLAEFVGQANAKKQATTALVEARYLKQPLGNLLLTGRAGNGKTTFARLLAREAGQPFDSIFWPPSTQDTLARRLVNTQGVILLDEIHRGGQKVQEWLYGAVNPTGNGTVQYGSGRTVELENCTIIGATTEVDEVAAPLRRRFMLELDFVPYDQADITLILGGMAERAGLRLCEEEIARLAKACGGKPGMAERLVAAARGLTIQYGSTEPADVFEHLEMDEDGLENRHRLYLTTMARIVRVTGKGVGLDVMADHLDLSKDTVKEIERRLQYAGLLFVGLAGGREFTKDGDARVVEIKRKWGI